jgi:hypothetical protein
MAGVEPRSEVPRSGCCHRARDRALRLALGLVVVAALLVMAAPAMADDFSPPQIAAFSLTPGTIDTGVASQTLTLTVTLTDDQAGVASEGDLAVDYSQSMMSLAPLIGTQKVWFLLKRISGDDLNGVYTATAVVPRGSTNGVWRVSSLQLADKLGNVASLGWQDLETLFGAGCATVMNAAAASDSTPPQITAFRLTPSAIDTQWDEQTLNVEVTLTDDQAGVASQGDLAVDYGQCGLQVSAIAGTQNVYFWLNRVSGDDLNGVYTATAVVPRGSTNGVWRTSSLQLADKLGNVASLGWQDLETLFGAGCASVTNAATESDSTPPQITAFSLTPAEVDTESQDETLTLTVTLTDDQAGVASEGDLAADYSQSMMSLAPLIGTQKVWFLLKRISGDDLNGVYTATAVLPKGSKEGVWRVMHLQLADKLGNVAIIDADAVNALLPGAEGLSIANTAVARQVTIDREWTISTSGTAVTFPAGTVVARQDDGLFAFYRMTCEEFTVDDTLPVTDLGGAPVAALHFGIPGLNLSFDRPVAISMNVGAQYNGTALLIQSLTEGGAAWANETTCEVVDGRCRFTVSHATRYVASVVEPPVVTDVTAPITSAFGYDDSWHAAPVAVSFSASDPGPDATGVAYTEYKLDDAPWVAATGVVVPAPSATKTVHTILYRSRDNAGNLEDSKSCTVKIDTTAPVPSDTMPPVTIVNGGDDLWHAAPVTLDFVSSDAGPAASGVAYTEYWLAGRWTKGTTVTLPAPADHSGDGVHVVGFRSADSAVPANLEPLKTATVRIDTTAPAVRALTGATVRTGKTVRLRYRVDDGLPGGVALSPEAAVQIAIVSARGKALKRFDLDLQRTNMPLTLRWVCTLKPGTYRFRVFATDLAGNVQSRVGSARLTVR